VPKRDNAELLAEIERLQAVQRKHPPTSSAWRRASAALTPLFTEMHRRTAPKKNPPRARRRRARATRARARAGNTASRFYRAKFKGGGMPTDVTFQAKSDAAAVRYATGLLRAKIGATKCVSVKRVDGAGSKKKRIPRPVTT